MHNSHRTRVLADRNQTLKGKWKDKAFAAGVDRAEIEHNVAALGVDLTEHIGFTIAAMRGIAPALGLDGSLAQNRPT